jgi:hypothetical protein
MRPASALVAVAAGGVSVGLGVSVAVGVGEAAAAVWDNMSIANWATAVAMSSTGGGVALGAQAPRAASATVATSVRIFRPRNSGARDPPIDGNYSLHAHEGAWRASRLRAVVEPPHYFAKYPCA